MCSRVVLCLPKSQHPFFAKQYQFNIISSVPPPQFLAHKFPKAVVLHSSCKPISVLVKIGSHQQTPPLKRLFATLRTWYCEPLQTTSTGSSAKLYSINRFVGCNDSGDITPSIFRVKWTKLWKLAYTKWHEEMDQCGETFANQNQQ